MNRILMAILFLGFVWICFHFANADLYYPYHKDRNTLTNKILRIWYYFWEDDDPKHWILHLTRNFLRFIIASAVLGTGAAICWTLVKGTWLVIEHLPK